MGHAANEPKTLMEALIRNYKCFQDVEAVHWVTLGGGAYCVPEMKDHLRHDAMFACAATRDAIQAGRTDYTPISFYESTRNFSNGTFSIDVVLVSVTPPDEHGYVSLSCSVCATRAAVLHARLVIVRVNAKMPWTMGPVSIFPTLAILWRQRKTFQPWFLPSSDQRKKPLAAGLRNWWRMEQRCRLDSEKFPMRF